MPKRKPRVWTEEQKQAARERLIIARAKKQTKQAEQDAELGIDVQAAGNDNPYQREIETTDDDIEAKQLDIEEELAKVPEPTVAQTKEQNTEELLRHALEAIANLTGQLQGQQGNAGTRVQNNRLVGVTEKYSTDFGRYPDPRERLFNEPRLQRVGIKENFDMDWKVDTVEYQTIDGIRMKEPKFQLDLIRVVYTETGEKTDGRYLEYRNVFFEDPDTALWVARRNNIDVNENDETGFLNEMRYLQVRDWLLECFYKPTNQVVSGKKEMVIDGKVVDYYEVNAENPTGINFGELERKG